MTLKLILMALLAHLIGDFILQGEWLTHLRFPSELFQKGATLTPFEAFKAKRHIYLATQKLEKQVRPTFLKGSSRFKDDDYKQTLETLILQPPSYKTLLKATYKGNVLHGMLQGLSFYLVISLYPYLTQQTLSLPFINGLVLVGGYSFLHIFIDQLKVCLTFRYLKHAHHISFFIMDQFLHLATFFLLPSFYHLNLFLNLSPLNLFLTDPKSFFLLEKELWICITVLITTVFAGIFIKKLMEHIDEKEVEVPLEEPHTEMRHGGYIIGILERILVASAILMGHPQLIGYILTAKSIARLKKLKDDKFAEYFLIGNFLSFTFAIGGGVFLRFLFTA
nr:hypothetical protein [uncultured Niameybacter sp.]